MVKKLKFWPKMEIWYVENRTKDRYLTKYELKFYIWLENLAIDRNFVIIPKFSLKIENLAKN